MYGLIRDLQSFKEVKINPHLPVFCDTETCIDEGFSSGGLYGQVRLFQMYQKDWDKAIIVDCYFVPLFDVLDLLVPHHLVFHNGAYDLHTINLKTKEVWVPRELDDTVYLSRLKYNTKQRFGFHECLKYADLADELILSINKKEEQKSDWSGALSLKQKTYAASDVTYLEKLYEEVKSCSEDTVYKLDIQNLKFALKYARNGMPINQKTVAKYQKKYISKLENLLETLPINPRSSKQACEYLGTKSSNSDVLTEMIFDGNEKAKKVRDGRHYYKALEYLNRYNRPRIKGFFQPCAAIAGRFSCNGGDSYNHANLQQMPQYLHEIVEAPEGYVIIYKDYSGLELRMAVAYTGEPTMSGMMKDGADMHTETGKYIFGKKEITDLERTIAKTFNFGLIYGAGVKTVQNTLKIDANIRMPFMEVKALILKWFDMYDYFGVWHAMHKDQLNVYGYVDIETALGRKIRTYKLTDSLNFPIQGSSVEVTKVSLGLLETRYPDNNLIDTIHDANILLAPKEEEELWGNRLSECMVEAWEYVIEDLPAPDIPMPHGYDAGKIWTFH